ncbi:MAG: M15 family metallopeptidase [Rhodothermaceae bacterium]|nr:M15 family metallopeptidase [Rhodothermaceae bacterium]
MAPSPVQPDSLPDGFVYLRDAAPTILQEMRYTTAYNFVGEPIDGYEAPECVLTTRAAQALAAVQAEVEADGLSLKVYDCYRPQQAVNHFVRWARNDDQTMKRAFYPEEPKGRLFARGYIARRSGHSRGSTVDLTLVPLPYTPPGSYPDPADGPLLRCDRPLSERYAEGDLDMGTAYDCLSELAATDNAAVGPEVLRNRRRLRAVMDRHGFRNYHKEWWHYTLRDEPFRQTFHDFPVQ